MYFMLSRLKVTTDAGDICLWDDCHSEVSELYTRCGNITCKRLYGSAKVLIQDQVCHINLYKSASI